MNGTVQAGSARPKVGPSRAKKSPAPKKPGMKKRLTAMLMRPRAPQPTPELEPAQAQKERKVFAKPKRAPGALQALARE